ncbi:MAG: hypothetical protein ACREBR_02720 [bacterium]
MTLEGISNVVHLDYDYQDKMKLSQAVLTFPPLLQIEEITAPKYL